MSLAKIAKIALSDADEADTASKFVKLALSDLDEAESAAKLALSDVDEAESAALKLAQLFFRSSTVQT